MISVLYRILLVFSVESLTFGSDSGEKNLFLGKYAVFRANAIGFKKEWRCFYVPDQMVMEKSQRAPGAICCRPGYVFNVCRAGAGGASYFSANRRPYPVSSAWTGKADGSAAAFSHFDGGGHSFKDRPRLHAGYDQ